MLSGYQDAQSVSGRSAVNCRPSELEGNGASGKAILSSSCKREKETEIPGFSMEAALCVACLTEREGRLLLVV